MLKIYLIVPLVPTPNIKLTPSRNVYYVGENLNVTCTSSIMGAVFTWRAVDFLQQQLLTLPNTTINISDHSSVLVFKLITFSGHFLIAITCTATLPGNENIIGGISTVVSFETTGRLF